MKDGKFTVGIIGLDFGEWHLKAALEKELEIVGICDKRVDRLNYVGDKHGIPEEKRYTDYNELLAILKTPRLFEFGNNSHNTGGEMAAFIDAIVNNKPIPTPAEEGAKTVATCLAIIESAKTGEKVKPDYDFYKA